MFTAILREAEHLRLVPTPAVAKTLDSTQIGGSLAKWLSAVEGVSQVQLEQGLDLIEVRFYFTGEIFYSHYEHYTDSFWLDTDSSPALMLLSDVAQALQKHIEQTIEFN
jgi:hypothetical protein